MFVNEAYRVWHGAAHMDDARMAPLNEQHFDGYRTGDSTNTPFGPGERVPGLAVGGWFDAGDFDMQGGHHALMVATLAEIWETFHPQHDQTLVDQKLNFVDIHRPDGQPDVLQQLEHGALQVAAQFRVLGGLTRGVVDGLMHTYTHLGDPSTQTDNLIYDPSLKPYEVRDGRSGTPDDRWVYMSSPPGTSYSGIDALAAASKSLRGFNDSLATECLSLAEKAYAAARVNAPAQPPQARFGGRFGSSELSAVLQLMVATGKQEYTDRFNELVWTALDQVSDRKQIGPGVLPDGFQDDPGDARVLKHPVIAGKHVPIEDSPGRSPIPVHIRMFISKPEVEQDGADHRMDERLVVFVVGKREKLFHPLRKLPGRRWHVQRLAIAFVDYVDRFLLGSKAACCGGVVQGVFRQRPVQLVEDVHT